jgi:hypothetical protein
MRLPPPVYLSENRDQEVERRRFEDMIERGIEEMDIKRNRDRLNGYG